MLTHILEGVQPWHMQKDSHFNFIVGKVQHSMIAGLVLCDVKETSLMGYVYAAFVFYLPNFRQIKRFQKLWCRLTQDKVQC